MVTLIKTKEKTIWIKEINKNDQKKMDKEHKIIKTQQH